MLSSNHPTLVETLIIAVLGWPLMLFSPRFFIWSMPDRNLFPWYLRWVNHAARGIEVDRGNKLPLDIQPGSQAEREWRAETKQFNFKAFRKTVNVLKGRNTIVVHVEGGRTFKYQERGVRLLTSTNGREIGEVQEGIFQLAKTANAQILPMYIDMSPERLQLRSFGAGIKGLFQKGLGPIIFRIEHDPYYVESPLDIAKEKAKLEGLLLNP